MALCIVSYAYLLLCTDEDVADTKRRIGHSQFALKLCPGRRDKIQVRTTKVAFECLVCGASRNQGLVQRGVLKVPREPVFTGGQDIRG